MKGEYNQECNITSCQKPNSAVWFNHSTRKYYCSSCAKRLNEDIFNKRDAQEMFGHPLCTLGESISLDDEYYKGEVLKLKSIPIMDIERPVEIKSGRESRRERRAKERKNNLKK